MDRPIKRLPPSKSLSHKPQESEKRSLTSRIGNKTKKRVIVINSDTETEEDGESSDQGWIKIGDIELTNDHRDHLLGGKWLDDCHIHAAQQLIKVKPDLGHIGSLQSPIATWADTSL